MKTVKIKIETYAKVGGDDLKECHLYCHFLHVSINLYGYCTIHPDHCLLEKTKEEQFVQTRSETWHFLRSEECLRCEE